MAFTLKPSAALLNPSQIHKTKSLIDRIASMTDHPMQPTTRQIREWFDKSSQAKGINEMDMPAAHVARMAYAAGADAELEGCCDVLARWGVHGIDRLRTARRSKPPSLKQQALEALDSFEGFTGSLEEVDIIRCALESLPDPQD